MYNTNKLEYYIEQDDMYNVEKIASYNMQMQGYISLAHREITEQDPIFLYLSIGRFSFPSSFGGRAIIKESNSCAQNTHTAYYSKK